MDRVVVGRRAAVASEFSGQGFAFGLLRGVVASEAAGLGRIAVVAGTDESLMGVYERDGWRRTGVWYQNRGLVGVRDEVIVLDVAEWFKRNPDFQTPPERA